MPKVGRTNVPSDGPARSADDVMVPTTDAAPLIELPAKPKYSPLTATTRKGAKVEFRRIPVPQHRMTPLKTTWMDLYKTVTEILKLDMRMNLKTRKVEIKTTKEQTDTGLLQKAADYVHAYLLAQIFCLATPEFAEDYLRFELKDALALIRMDNLYIESFEIKDVKTLKGEHLSRAIGRISGKDGKTKFTIENASHTRIVLADTKIHILGNFQNIRVARDSICALILGSPAGKMYNRLRNTASRINGV